MRRSQAGPHAASPSRKFTDEDECQLVTADIETFQILCQASKVPCIAGLAAVSLFRVKRMQLAKSSISS